eukprot:2767871-Prorocentrum_lima.AAC.1
MHRIFNMPIGNVRRLLNRSSQLCRSWDLYGAVGGRAIFCRTRLFVVLNWMLCLRRHMACACCTS